MPIRVGILSSAHVHAPSFVGCCIASPNAEVAGLWDDDADRGKAFAADAGIPYFESADDLLARVDAVVICSENMKHADHIEMSCAAGKHVLCEKPIAPNLEHANRIKSAVEKAGVTAMTAFPCPHSPVFGDLAKRVEAGDIGSVLALSTTNRGKSPGGWFTDPELSGGGAMIDHVVHVTDLLRRLLKADPIEVFAQIGSNMHGKDSDDTAMLTISFPGGIFASLDSSWSRPDNFKTWGDVTIRAVGEKGVLEADLFASGLEQYSSADGYSLMSVGANLDQVMVDEFLNAINEKREPATTIDDGIMASRTAIAAYESVKTGQPVKI